MPFAELTGVDELDRVVGQVEQPDGVDDVGAAATQPPPLIEPQSAIAQRDPLPEQDALADDVNLLCSTGIGRGQRSAGDQPGRTNISPGNAPLKRRSFSVHIPSASFTSAGFRPPWPFTPTSGDLQAFRAR